MIKTMDQAERDAALRVADLMAAAARTAPKGSGKDKVITIILTGEDKAALVKEMHQAAAEYKEDFIERDAFNVESSHCVVLIGVTSQPFGLANCKMCGFKNCAEMKKAGANCAFNITDLGIAVGSAVSVAADHRIDNRVMYSAGRGAVRMGIFPEDVRVCCGIPLYTGSKSIFFDRGPGSILL
ncbi:ferredoxin domain-containing protein [Ihubacter sp. mB4P-1]|uniref:ferredoxin domain-containing protein n=1 Tax=Ihubacter sp. mB4P-1 TaxID=3242370 RepID=UPI003C7D74DC